MAFEEALTIVQISHSSRKAYFYSIRWIFKKLEKNILLDKLVYIIKIRLKGIKT